MSMFGDAASIVTATGGIIATSIWAKGKLLNRKQQKAITQRRNWHGYIEPAGINTWFVKLLEEPDRPSARVVLEVIDGKGQPDEMGGQGFRQRVIGDGMLSRSPTPAELEFLMALRKERGYGDGDLIR